MEKKYPDGTFAMIRLKKGEDLVSGIEDAVKSMGTDSAAILFGVGMLEDVEVGYWDARAGEYIREKLKEPVELVSVSGTLAPEGIHLHAALAVRDHHIVGGHLFSGKVAVVAELGIVLLAAGSLKREYDPETSLNLLVL